MGARVLTTDGVYETEHNTADAHPGSVIVVVPPGGKPRVTKHDDTAGGAVSDLPA